MVTNLGVGNVVMVEARNLPSDTDDTYMHVGEVVHIRNIQQNNLSFRTLYKKNPNRRRSKYLITVRRPDGSYFRFYNTDIITFVVARDKA